MNRTTDATASAFGGRPCAHRAANTTHPFQRDSGAIVLPDSVPWTQNTAQSAAAFAAGHDG